MARSLLNLLVLNQANPQVNHQVPEVYNVAKNIHNDQMGLRANVTVTNTITESSTIDIIDTTTETITSPPITYTSTSTYTKITCTFTIYATTPISTSSSTTTSTSNTSTTTAVTSSNTQTAYQTTYQTYVVTLYNAIDSVVVTYTSSVESSTSVYNSVTSTITSSDITTQFINTCTASIPVARQLEPTHTTTSVDKILKLKRSQYIGLENMQKEQNLMIQDAFKAQNISIPQKVSNYLATFKNAQKKQLFEYHRSMNKSNLASNEAIQQFKSFQKDQRRLNSKFNKDILTNQKEYLKCSPKELGVLVNSVLPFRINSLKVLQSVQLEEFEKNI